MAEPKVHVFKEEKPVYDKNKKIWTGEKYRGHYNTESSVGQIVFEELRRNPKRICQISVSEQTQLTNEDAMQQAIKITKHFEKLGIKQSDIIGIAAENTTYVLGVVLACFFHGSAYHAINPVFDKNTTKHLFAITKPKLIFCDGSALEKIEEAVSDWKPTIITMKPHTAGVSSVPDLLRTTDLPNYYEPAELEHGLDQNLCIICSSGSTGLPKAVTISNRLRLFDIYNHLTAEDVQFVNCVLEWIIGVLSILLSVVYGAKRIITEGAVTAEQYLEIVHKYKATFTIDAPSLLVSLLKCNSISAEKLASMRYVVFGGGKCTLQTRNKIQSYMPNCQLIYLYSFTEFHHWVAHNHHLSKKPDSVGPLGKGNQAKLLGNDGLYLGPHEVGELLLCKGIPWQGYYNDPESTALLYDKDGWYHTGDLGFFDDDGYLYIVGRKKDLLKYQELHYTHGEVEEIIANMPDVTDVCVFGIYSELNGDEAAAVVVTKQGSKLTAEDVVTYVRNSTEEFWKHLHAGAVILDEIPKHPNGKVDRAAAKKKFSEEYVKKEL